MREQERGDGADNRASLAPRVCMDMVVGPHPMARLTGDWEIAPFDTIPVATVYLLSPENAVQNSEPGPDGSPYVNHHVFWNLVHDVTVLPPAGSSENMTLPTGLALAGVLFGLVPSVTATLSLRRRNVVRWYFSRE